MTWRVARSLDVLLAEIDASAPNRSRSSDGSIGDPDHAATVSDHNPWCGGEVVTARDFTHDPVGGFDSYAYAEWQRRRCRGDILINGRRETRVKYIISNRRIASPTDGWAWRPYAGDSPHTGHVHVSVDCADYMDSTEPWGWEGTDIMTPEQERLLRNAETYAWKEAVGEANITGIAGGDGKPVPAFPNVPHQQHLAILGKLDEILTLLRTAGGAGPVADHTHDPGAVTR